jgi:predicted RNA-binding Zn-ribbon protein involved in translation (DUF1610 family)
MTDKNITPEPAPEEPRGRAPKQQRGETAGDRNLKAASSSGMACPRCGGPVAVGTNPVLMQFGLIGALLHLLMTSYSCPKCGPIKFSEFPKEVRDGQRQGILLWVLLGILLVAAGIAVGVWMAMRE